MPGTILAMARRAPHYEVLATPVSFSHYFRNAFALVPEDHDRVTWDEKSAGVLKAMSSAMLEREPTTLPLAASAAPLIAAASQHAPMLSRTSLYALSVCKGTENTQIVFARGSKLVWCIYSNRYSENYLAKTKKCRASRGHP